MARIADSSPANSSAPSAATPGSNQRRWPTRLGISVSYLSLLESGERPLTANIVAALGRRHPAALAAIEGAGPAQRLAALADALADPALPPTPPHDVLARLAEERPEHRRPDRRAPRRQTRRGGTAVRRRRDDDRGPGGRLPWEAVRDWFHAAGNYVDPLDRAAEALATALRGPSWRPRWPRAASRRRRRRGEDAPLRPLRRPHAARCRPPCRRKAAGSRSRTAWPRSPSPTRSLWSARGGAAAR